MSVTYDIENNEYVCHLYGKRIDVGPTVSFLYDNDSGILLKHGKTSVVTKCQKDMYKTYSLGEQYMPEEFRKTCADMKEALKVVTFKIKDDIDLETLNKFVDCTNFIKQWVDKKEKQ